LIFFRIFEELLDYFGALPVSLTPVKQALLVSLTPVRNSLLVVTTPVSDAFTVEVSTTPLRNYITGVNDIGKANLTRVNDTVDNNNTGDNKDTGDNKETAENNDTGNASFAGINDTGNACIARRCHLHR
jgi:hypothetical protein